MVFLIFQIATVPPISAQVAAPTQLEIEIHLLINEERARVDPSLPILRFHSTLIEVSRAHSKDMYDKQYFDHVNKEGLDPFDRISDGGVTYNAAAENLYYSEGYSERFIAERAVDGWIDSPGHYQNMIGYYAFTGIGVYSIGNTYYITQIFIQSSELEARSSGVIFENDNLQGIERPELSFYEKYQLEIILGSIILIVIFLGKKAEALNRQRFRR